MKLYKNGAFINIEKINLKTIITKDTRARQVKIFCPFPELCTDQPPTECKKCFDYYKTRLFNHKKWGVHNANKT